jgi:Ca2+-binding EF-hand superfamily protein
MDKATFLRFFSMPGMLGERLFQVFDRRQNGVIEWEEFVAGLADFCRGTMDEKILLLFRMYDLTGGSLTYFSLSID